MEIGWLDVCLRVADVIRSVAFYESLGFHRVSGLDAEGWAIVVRGEMRVGLYEAPHMRHPFCLNFRGANVGDIVSELGAAGHEFLTSAAAADGSGSAELLDPDGNLIYFDTVPGEIKRV